MTVLITLTVAGSDVGPFSLYSDLDGYTTPFATGVSKAALMSGYNANNVPDFTNTIRVQSTGVCDNYIDISVQYEATTTTTTTTTAMEVLYTTWWTTDNTGVCGNPCGQEKYTDINLAGNPLTVSYFYNTPDLTPNDYYAPGIGTIGFTNESFGNAIFTADIAIDGSLSNNAICGD